MFSLFKVIKNKKGFTLVELIVVMAVLAIISAIAVPRFLGVQEKAREDADYATGAMIAKAAELYEAKENYSEPTITADVLVTDGYLSDVKFKTDMFKECALSDIQITYDEGAISVDALNITGQTGPVALYPRP